MCGCCCGWCGWLCWLKDKDRDRDTHSFHEPGNCVFEAETAIALALYNAHIGKEHDELLELQLALLVLAKEGYKEA